MRHVALFLLAAACAAKPLLAGDAERPGEADLRHAGILAQEGDLPGAVTLWFKVLRQADNQDLRSEARENLAELGLTGQEIFQLAPAALKPEDWDRLLTRLSVNAAQQRRRELDIEYAKGLLRSGVVLRIQPDGKIKVEVQPKDLTRALELLLQIALAETDPEGARDAQSRLESLSIVGPQVEVVRKSVAEGKLSAALQNELVCGVCLHLLEKYRGWLEEREEHEDAGFRKQLARRFGVAIYKYLAAQHTQTATFKRPSDHLDYWRDLSAPPTPAAEKTF